MSTEKGMCLELHGLCHTEDGSCLHMLAAGGWGGSSCLWWLLGMLAAPSPVTPDPSRHAPRPRTFRPREPGPAPPLCSMKLGGKGKS